jgi:hypothetical protein
MKSEVTHKETEARQEYPCLKVNVGGLLVLFKNETTGVILNAGKASGYCTDKDGKYKAYGVGVIGYNWKIDSFQTFHGTVTLSND